MVSSMRWRCRIRSVTRRENVNHVYVVHAENLFYVTVALFVKTKLVDKYNFYCKLILITNISATILLF